MKDESDPGEGFGAIVIRSGVVEVEWLKFVNVRARDRVGVLRLQRSGQERVGRRAMIR